jgi:GTPase SAR1 family protein
MDNWRIAVLGDGGVGKTALAVQVSTLAFATFPSLPLSPL